MKKLLIHSQDTIISEEHLFPASEQYVFEVNNEDVDVDHYITLLLSSGNLHEKIMNSDVIFIKLSLTENYLEYLGLRLAYHIRLAPQLKEKKNLPIILVGEESYQFIGLTSSIPQILFTKGIYVMPDTREELERHIKMFNDGKLKKLDCEKDFINKISIPAPANYTSRHSIANEWNILRWAEMGKNFSNDLREELNKVNTSNQSLYFKYLEKKYLVDSDKENRQGFKKDSNRQNLTIPFVEGVKIYYIDDEVNKGWGLLFKDGIFKDYTEKTSFSYYDGFKKGEDTSNQLRKILEEVENLVTKQGFNLFIIDLRLFDSDFKREAKPTGFQLIEKIQNLNLGVQIVIFTASKNAENILKAQNLKVSGYVIKESPENVLTRSESWQQFMSFANNIKKAANFTALAGMHDKITKLKNASLFHNSAKSEEKDFYVSFNSAGGFADRIFKLLNTKETDLLGSAFLDSFAMLEKFTSIFYSEYEKDIKGSVKKLDNIDFIHLDINKEVNSFKTSIEFNRGDYDFQTNKQQKTPIDATFHDELQNRSHNAPGCGTRGMVRNLAVLKYRFDLNTDDLREIMRMTYIRNNLAAHDTGEIVDSFKLKFEDIRTLLEICEKVFLIQKSVE